MTYEIKITGTLIPGYELPGARAELEKRLEAHVLDFFGEYLDPITDDIKSESSYAGHEPDWWYDAKVKE
jgi:hypothetical protein